MRLRTLLSASALTLAVAFGSQVSAQTSSPLQPSSDWAQGKHLPTTVTLVAQHGRFAIVRMRGGEFEGDPIDWEVLVEHFDFGWQNVDQPDLPFKCSVPAASCSALIGDVGSSADVVAVRKQMQVWPLFVYSVRVLGDYALAYGVYGEGETIFRHSTNGWKKISHSGCGAFAVSDLHAEGVPTHDAQILLRR